MKDPMTITLELPHDFSGQRRALVVQKLPPGTPFGCKSDGDTCPLPADWIVLIAHEVDEHRGVAGMACQEHIAGLMWTFCSDAEGDTPG